MLTNIQEDHLGLNDIHTLDDLSRVKEVVINSVKKSGWAVINADNEYCVKIGKKASCNVVYFSMDENNPLIVQQSGLGNISCVYENGYITIKKGDWKIRVQKAAQIPLTFGGAVSFMVQNVLAATLTAFVWGFRTEDIKTSLETFIPSAAQTPGRMNIFPFKDFKIMVDFAHNPDGFNGIKQFLQTIDSPQKIGLIAGTGDRRDEDIREIGKIAAEMFDHVILRQENHLRGRKKEELLKLMEEGVLSAEKKTSYEIATKETDVIEHAIRMAKPGAFIVALSDVVDNAIDVVLRFQEKEHAGTLI